MLLMNVVVVADCPCDGHAWVHLLDSSGEHGTRVLIDAAVGRAITSEPRGTPDTHAEAIDLLWSALHALGARLERVELNLDSLGGPATGADGG